MIQWSSVIAQTIETHTKWTAVDDQINQATHKMRKLSLLLKSTLQGWEKPKGVWRYHVFTRKNIWCVQQRWIADGTQSRPRTELEYTCNILQQQNLIFLQFENWEEASWHTSLTTLQSIEPPVNLRAKFTFHSQVACASPAGWTFNKEICGKWIDETHKVCGKRLPYNLQLVYNLCTYCLQLDICCTKSRSCNFS